MKRHIPNFLTCCNLLCGCFALVFLFEGRSIPAAYFVWVTCLFDFFDGFAARMLKVASPIGKELDSLADMVSFGLVPSMVMYKMIDQATNFSDSNLPFIAFAIAVFSGLRLAIFNVDETQRDGFKGLNTPANTLFITSLPLLHSKVGDWLYSPLTLVMITIVFSLLLVSRIDIFALKFKNFSWQDNKLRFSFLLISVALIAIFQIVAIPLIILLYILLSLANNALNRTS